MSLRHSFISIGLALLGGIQAALGATVFSDVASNHPHYQAIQTLYEQGVIEGYADNTFRPEQPVNRAEALKILLLGSKIFVPEIQNQDIFPDVILGVWYAKYVAKAKNLAIVSGDSLSGLFRPGDTVNLAEALKMMLLTNTIPVKTPSGNPYADVPEDAWFAPYFGYAKRVGLLDAKSTDSVNPATPINRGMLAELMFRLSKAPKTDDYGKASFYGDKFHGRNTASGEVFDASAFTAAHRTYPFGTWLKVTNLENDQSVTVKVNDRGPYGDEDRILDLSKAAFSAIAPLSRGVIYVTLEIVEAPEKIPVVPFQEEGSPEMPEISEGVPNCNEKENLDFSESTTFESMVLDQEIPNRFLNDEILMLSGKILESATSVTAFLIDEKGEQITFQGAVKQNRFTVQVDFPREGRYNFGLIPGKEGKSLVIPLIVLSNQCVSEKEEVSLPPPPLPAWDINEAGEVEIRWPEVNYPALKLSFQQGAQKKDYFLFKKGKWHPYAPDFGAFKEGNLSLEIRGASPKNQTSFLQEDTLTWSIPSSLTLNATTHHAFLMEPDQIGVSLIPHTLTAEELLTLSVTPKAALRSQAAVIRPDGEVEEIDLKSDSESPIKNNRDIEIFPLSPKALSFIYSPASAGTYFIEINNAEGLAVLNLPLYSSSAFPVIPNLSEKSPRKVTDLGNNLEGLRKQFLDLVNDDREQFGRKTVILDDSLSKLAQARADDMKKNNYFGHWDAKGVSVNDLRKNYAIAQTVAENLAKDLTLELAEYGLMRSAIHRSLILGQNWTLAGFGIARLTDGSYIFVQLFSEDPLAIQNPEELRAKILSKINIARPFGPLDEDQNLTSLAQSWSDKMANDDFFALSDPAGQKLTDLAAKQFPNNFVGVAIFGNTSLNGLLSQIGEHAPLKSAGWRLIGIGVKQDAVGLIKATLIYSE